MNPQIAVSLLREWFDWWTLDDSAPTKMPAALHVRSALALSVTSDPELGTVYTTDDTRCIECGRTELCDICFAAEGATWD